MKIPNFRPHLRSCFCLSISLFYDPQHFRLAIWKNQGVCLCLCIHTHIFISTLLYLYILYIYGNESGLFFLCFPYIRCIHSLVARQSLISALVNLCFPILSKSKFESWAITKSSLTVLKTLFMLHYTLLSSPKWNTLEYKF